MSFMEINYVAYVIVRDILGLLAVAGIAFWISRLGD